MYIWTHRLIGQQICNALGSAAGFDQKAFIQGNVIPDLAGRYRQISHFALGCHVYMDQTFHRLLYSQKNASERSELLGIMCHFISDRFCKVHNGEFMQESMMTHMLYEYQLHQQMKKMCEDFPLAPVATPVGAIKNFEAETFRNGIREQMKQMHTEYIDGEASTTRDLIYAVKMSTIFCAEALPLLVYNHVDIVASKQTMANEKCA